MKEKITINIVWHDHRKPITLSIRKVTIKRFVFAGITLTILFSGFSIWSMLKHTENSKLRAKQEEILQEKKMLEEEARKLAQMKEKLQALERALFDLHSYLKERGIRLEKSKATGGGSVYEPLYEDRLDALLQFANKTYQTLRETPIGYPVKGNITSTFGWRKNPFGRGYEFHTGIDIEAPYGTPVLATADGKVVFVGNLPDYGKTVIVKHPSGYSTLYAHLSSMEIKEGQFIKAGQILGRVGSTGRSTGPHLHYEVILENKTLDPMKFLVWR